MQDFHIGQWDADTRRYTSRATKTSQDYYPEGMGKMYIVNAPWIFRAVYAVAKGWLDEKTRN